MSLLDAVGRDPLLSAVVLIVLALVPPATTLIGSRPGLRDAAGTGQHDPQAKGGEEHGEAC